MSRWTSECGAKTGISNCFPEARAHKAPGLGSLAPRHILTMQESSLTSHHTWLCDGRVLQLYDAVSPGNLALFQYQWARGHSRAFAKD